MRHVVRTIVLPVRQLFIFVRLILFALLDLEDVLYRQYHRFVTVPGSIFRFHVFLYQGAEHRLSDGTLVRQNDLVIALHLWNSRLKQLLRRVPRTDRRARFLEEVQRSLHVLARSIAEQPAYASVVALRARTILSYLNEDVRWPFDRFPVPRTPLTIAMRFSMRVFLARQHPKGLRRSFGQRSHDLQLVDFWISRPKFLASYGPHAPALR